MLRCTYVLLFNLFIKEGSIMFKYELLLAILKNIPFIAIGVFSIGFIIAFHEFGHFIFARLFGVSVPSFSIGFGPKLFKKTIKNTEFSLSLIPIGGYVEAETGDSYNPAPDTINAKSYLQKMCIIIGGIFFNLIFSYIIFFGVSIHGISENNFFPESGSFQLHTIVEDSAAQKAGLLPHDHILKFNTIDVSHNLKDFLKEISENPDQTVNLTISRNEETLVLPVTLDHKESNSKIIGSLGISKFCFESIAGVSWHEAFIKAFSLTWTTLTNTLAAFGGALKERSTETLSGPLMMISVVSNSIKTNPIFFLLLLAFISIGLAVLNMFPLPILDGGQALTYTIEALIRRPLPEKLKEYIHIGCWFLMMGLFIYLTFKDVIKLYLGL